MNNPGLITPKTADENIEAHRIVVNNGDSISSATGSSTYLYGVTTECKSYAGRVADVICSGQAQVELGGSVVCNDPLTSDAQGRAVKATQDGQYIIGYAEEDGNIEDVITFDFAKGQISVATQVS